MRKAIKHYEQALGIDLEIGDRQGEASALGSLGNAFLQLGELHKAIERYEQALAIDREIGDRLGEGNQLGNLGIAYRHLGEVRKAIEYHEQAVAIAREIGDRLGEGNQLFNLSVAHEQLGDLPAAITYAESALKILEAIESPNAERARQLFRACAPNPPGPSLSSCLPVSPPERSAVQSKGSVHLCLTPSSRTPPPCTPAPRRSTAQSTASPAST